MPALRAVCVYCGSRLGTDPALAAQARAFGGLLADRGITLVYGGGHVGIMGAVADGTLERGGRVIGVIPRGFVDRELERALQDEEARTGGRIVILDTTRPSRNLFSPLIDLHLHTVIPTLGKLITGEGEAYTYLPESTDGFLKAETLATRMLETGFRQVGFQRRMFGTVAIHWGMK